jgi:hypothetical protein
LQAALDIRKPRGYIGRCGGCNALLKLTHELAQLAPLIRVQGIAAKNASTSAGLAQTVRVSALV